MKLHATLEALYSERDAFGNCYWALRYTDHETGRVVVGTVSGGESNINAIRYQRLGQRDDGVTFRVQGFKIREFNRMTREWAHAGCAPADLWQHIQRELGGKAAE
jgi:hypothetical protein